jgi:hypothetical protein
VNIKYETCYPFTVPEALEDHRHLLIMEEDLCVRGNAADADTWPLYRCVLTVAAPPAYEGDLDASLMLNGTVGSYSVTGNVDMEEVWLHIHPKMMHRDSKEVHLGICITKLTVHH